MTFNDDLFHWEVYVAELLEEAIYGGTEGFIELMQDIAGGQWNGFESDGDNIVVLEEAWVSVRFDLNDGFVYFDEGTFNDPLLVIKISFIDLTQILEEWIEFLGSVDGGSYRRSPFE